MKTRIEIFRFYFRSIGEMYFQSDRIAKWGQQTMAEFEKIRTVGKGR